MGLSGYVYFHGILCNNNEQEWTVYEYLGGGEVCAVTCIPMRNVCYSS